MIAMRTVTAPPRGGVTPLATAAKRCSASIAAAGTGVPTLRICAAVGWAAMASIRGCGIAAIASA